MVGECARLWQSDLPSTTYVLQTRMWVRRMACCLRQRSRAANKNRNIFCFWLFVAINTFCLIATRGQQRGDGRRHGVRQHLPLTAAVYLSRRLRCVQQLGNSTDSLFPYPGHRMAARKKKEPKNDTKYCTKYILCWSPRTKNKMFPEIEGFFPFR